MKKFGRIMHHGNSWVVVKSFTSIKKMWYIYTMEYCSAIK